MAVAMEPALSTVDGWSRMYLDLPGTGSSPPGDPRSDAVLDEVQATIIGRVGEDGFAVVGWSYGAYLAAGLTRRVPDRIHGLMMICAGLKIRPADRDLTGALASIPQADWLSAVPHELHAHLQHAVGRQTAEVAQRVAAVVASNGPTNEQYLDELRTKGFALSDEDVPTAVDAPALVLAGRRDRVAGYLDAFRSHLDLPGADYVTLARAGHYLPIEEPHRFAALAAGWLRRCHPSPVVGASR